MGGDWEREREGGRLLWGMDGHGVLEVSEEMLSFFH